MRLAPDARSRAADVAQLPIMLTGQRPGANGAMPYVPLSQVATVTAG
ncbi:MAG: hypothetical protein IPK33_22750 [Gemmatimonadetes bacterium]|nr:hypothetical protein [Gemmatimonadota bacterium]